MKPIMVAITLVMTLALTGLGFAQEEEALHMKQALKHVNAAVMQGQKGDTKAFLQHAEAGLEHVRKAQEEKPSPDLERAIKSLEDGIKQGKAGDTNKATERAKESIEYIDSAIAALGG